MKCLPASKLSVANGVGIHDWHAEVLAMRAFNRFLLDECQRIMHNGQDSEILRRADSDMSRAPFQVKEEVRLHMYCSEAPCTLSMPPKWALINLYQVVMPAWS